MTATDKLTITGESIVAALRASLEAKGLNASGELSASLVSVVEKEVGQYTLTIYADKKPYWFFVNRATRGKGTGNPLALFGVILDWSRTKPQLRFENEKQRRGFAAAVSRNIQNGKYMDYKRNERRYFATNVIDSPQIQIEIAQSVQSVFEETVSVNLPFFSKSSQQFKPQIF